MTVEQADFGKFLLFVGLLVAFGLGLLLLNNMVTPESRLKHAPVVELNCAACDMKFGMPKQFIDERRKDHQEFFCPLGHKNLYK